LFLVQSFLASAMAFRGVAAPILFVGSAFAMRMSEFEDEGVPWHHSWCNPFSRLSDKDYRFEVNWGDTELMMQLSRKSDSVHLRMMEGHWDVWRPHELADILPTDLIWDANLKPGTPVDITVDLLKHVRYLRRTRFGNNAPSRLEVQWINGFKAEFAGGVWYPPDATLTSAKHLLVPNGTGVHDEMMTRQLDGKEFPDVRMIGLPLRNMSLAGEATRALVVGTLTDLAGVAVEGAMGTLLFPGHAIAEATNYVTWARSQHSIHYAASDKWFDKLWCHPLYKRCEAEGVIVPRNQTCPQTDAAGELLPPGFDGPTDFFLVSERSGCEGGSTEEIHTSSNEIIMRWMNADASQDANCFHLDTLPWDATVGPQWYKMWCDTSTGVSGLQSFTDSSCDVNTGQYANLWQLSANVCVYDPTFGFSARHHCVANPAAPAPAPTPAPVQECSTLAMDDNAACRHAVSWAFSDGKYQSWAGDAYNEMMPIAGVTHSEANLGDFHRLFYCGGVEGSACGSAPCECSNPPCNVCR